MNINDEGGLDLTSVESEMLAQFLVGQFIENDQEWLLWESVPNLSEGAFQDLTERVKAYGSRLSVEARVRWNGVGRSPATVYDEATAVGREVQP
jgi:hypothetical protein